MGSWTEWHFAAFIAVAGLAAWLSRGASRPTSAGYGGWLIVFSLFLGFWAAQELAEFYRVKAQIQTLVPSASDSPAFHAYIGYAMVLAWLEAVFLVAVALMIIGTRAIPAVRAAIGVLWIAGPVCATIEFMLADYYFDEYLVEDDYTAIAATTLFATVWTWYLLTARRVGYRRQH
ncbi:DUF2569 family protein [Parapusillimonas sp. SGNA-6]|nr:DUF2569 family protein [Parapusillimonas sp. SGNA-6]